MSDSVRRAIEDMKEILAPKAAEVAKLRQTINGMARAIGDEPPFPDEEPETAIAARKSATIRPDEFFGRSPITAAREYLEKVGEPRAADDILAALSKGGFDFDAQDWDEKVRLRNLAISLSKNTAIFTRLPSGPFGLTKWYPELKRPKARPVEAADKDKQRPADTADTAADAESNDESTTP